MDFSIKVSDIEDSDLPIPKIKVLGVGGAGQNAVNRMIDSDLTDVDFVVINTDKQALVNSRAKSRIQIGSKLTKGLGAGANPIIGEKAAEEDQAKIRELLKNIDLVFITAGMGGGTGTGAAPVIAKIARDMGSLVIAIVTKPFRHEGKNKVQKAEEGIKKLRQFVDTMIVIPNDRLSQASKSSLSLFSAFGMADEILHHSVQGLSDILTKHGFINVDFQDIKTVLKNQGYALLGIGEGSGENRIIEAVNKAIANNLIENINIDGAKAAIVNIECGSDFQMNEYDEIMNSISQKMDADSMIIPGIIRNESYKDLEKIRITIIATGFSENAEKMLTKEYEGESLSVPEVKVANGLSEKIIAFDVYDKIKRGAFDDDSEIPSFLKHKKLSDTENE